jgi:hypothetical protein
MKIRSVEFQQDVLLTPYDIAPGDCVQSYSLFKYLEDSKRPEYLSAEEFHIIPMTHKHCSNIMINFSKKLVLCIYGYH